MLNLLEGTLSELQEDGVAYIKGFISGTPVLYLSILATYIW